MTKDGNGYNFRKLLALLLFGLAYCGLLYYRRPLTWSDKADGIISMMLGLYICSHPVANLLDIFFYNREIRRRLSSWAVVLWLLLNAAVFFLGWFVIFLGTTRLAEQIKKLNI